MNNEYNSIEAFASHLATLRQQREERKAEHGSKTRQRTTLNKEQRNQVFEKTAGHCHICGGKIEGKWQADHVIAHSAGGDHNVENYLPAHAVCNNYRWDYTSEEFQTILKLGVWTRTQIENRTTIGNELARQFIAKEQSRLARQTKKNM